MVRVVGHGPPTPEAAARLAGVDRAVKGLRERARPVEDLPVEDETPPVTRRRAAPTGEAARRLRAEEVEGDVPEAREARDAGLRDPAAVPEAAKDADPDRAGALGVAESALIVAIDGPSGVGKSTVSEEISRALGLPKLDTGAMYRAAGLKVLEAGVDPADTGAVVELVEASSIEVRTDPGPPTGSPAVWLDGQPVGSRIRSPRVSEVTSRISAIPAVRRRMVALQRRFAAEQGAVVEGRDIGTVVFPDTPLKFFLTASPEVRAERRFLELTRGGHTIDREAVRRDMERRDARDSGREDSPLADDGTYIRVDTSDLEIPEVVRRMVAEIRQRTA